MISEIEGLALTVGRLMAVIKALEVERDKLKAEIDKLKAQLSPED